MRINQRRMMGTRKLRLEQLETRRLLAGNVSVTQQGNTLLVRGDNLANEIGIFSAGGDDFTVVGVDTTVNGDDERTFSGILNFNIDLRGGDDFLSIADDATGLADVPDAVDGGFPIDLSDIGETTPTEIDGFVLIRMGAGADTVALAVNTGSFVDIATGTGNDQVAVLNSDIGAHLFVRSEDGSDGVAVLDSFVDTTLLLEGGRGADSIFVQTLDATTIVGNGGRDNDEVGLYDVLVEGSIVVIGDHGSDDLEVEYAGAQSVTINGGDGDDSIDADGVETTGNLVILGGGGSDDVEVEPNEEYVEEGVDPTSVGGALIIDGGAGNDSLEAELVEANSITIIGGAGNDDLNADGVSVVNHVIMNGGPGNNFIDVGSSDDDEFDPGLSSEIGGFLHVIGGSGRDEAFIIDVFVGQHLLVNVAGGNDSVEISAVEVRDFVLALMGSGNDDLTYFDVTAGGDETLDGGAGFDLLFIDFSTGRRIRNFEDIELDFID